MGKHFSEVLERESTHLAGVADGAALTRWSRGVVDELMTSRSPYVLALGHGGDPRDRADFLERWRELIAETVHRLLESGAIRDDRMRSGHASTHGADADPKRIAVLILAALHGGSTLSHLVQDPAPLHAALDLALMPFFANEGYFRVNDGNSRSDK